VKPREVQFNLSSLVDFLPHCVNVTMPLVSDLQKLGAVE